MLRAVSTRFVSNCGCRAGLLGRTPLIQPSLSATVIPSRSKSYFESDLEGPPQLYTDVEKSYAEWKWVERLMPPQTVPPGPSEPGKEFPSGWRVPNPPKDCSYYIPRNKNHMVPVYTLIFDRGMIRETRVRHIEGNIWEFEKDVGRYLKSIFPKKKVISTYTQECARFVGIKGDFTEEIKEWLYQRGF